MLAHIQNRIHLCFMCACMLCSIACAHPHMFIDVSMKFMLSDSGLAGIYVYWEMDEMNSAWLIDEYDKNKNRIFEKAEQNAIRSEAFGNAAGQNYFLSLTWGITSLHSVVAEQFSASIKNKSTVVYSFYIPCNIGLRRGMSTQIYLFFEDPTIYIAFTLKKGLIKVSSNDYTEGSISFQKIDYSDAAVLQLKRK